MTTIIKAGESGSVLRRLSTVDLADHLAEADAVIAAAQRQAEQIVVQAQAKADELNNTANHRGYDEGFAKGVAEGAEKGKQTAFDEAHERFLKEQESLVADLSRALEEIEKVKADLQLRAEQDVLKFAVRLASKLTCAIGESYPESAQQNLLKALRLVGSKTDLTLKVHPQDAESMKRFAPTVVESFDASRAVSLVEDEAIQPGGCIVQTLQTSIDATIDTQLDEMVQLILGHSNKDKPRTGGEDHE